MPLIRKTRKEQKKHVPPKKVVDMNDYCLFNIFEYLSPSDMCAVKDTCHRFRGLAERHMELYYISKEFRIPGSFKDNNCMKVFIKFCGVFKKLQISVSRWSWNPENDRKIFSAIQKYNPKLDSLSIAGKDFAMALSRMPTIFSKLKKIELIQDYTIEFEYNIQREQTIKYILKRCTNVEEICFHVMPTPMGCRYQGIFLNKKFKYLRSLNLCSVLDIDLNNLILFLQLNSNLQKITLRNCVKLRDLSYINFARNAPNIQGIAISFGNVSHIVIPLSHANEFKFSDKLQSLSFDTCKSRITDFIISLSNKNSLNYLSLANVWASRNEGLGEAFYQMTNLRILRLNIRFSYNYIKHFFKLLCSNLVNLVELHLFDCNLIFLQIIDIVEYSISLKKLYLPYIDNIHQGKMSEENYMLLVDKHNRKNSASQLSIFFELNSYEIVLTHIPRCVLEKNSDVIKVSKFNPLHFDKYWLPN